MRSDTTGLDVERLRAVSQRIGPASPLFVTVTGAHLYGYASKDSDVDLRGAHLLPIERVIGLRPSQVKHKSRETGDRLDVDYVSVDLAECLRLLVGKNGYVLEQILSPHVVLAWPGFETLRDLARGTLSRGLYHHYRGWARGRWKDFTSEEPRRVKLLIDVYRVLLTGTRLLETGELVSSLPALAEAGGHDDVMDLISRRVAGERLVLERSEAERHAQRVSELESAMQRAFEQSSLPDAAPNLDDVERFLVETRLQTWGAADTNFCARDTAADS